MGWLFSLLYFLLLLYLLILIGRLIVEWVQIFSRDWRPRGVLLVVAEVFYTVTDPPLRWLRRFIPPLRLGGIALDLSFIVLFLAVSLLMRLAWFLSLTV